MEQLAIIPNKKHEEAQREGFRVYKREISYLLFRAAIIGSLNGYKQGVKRSGKWKLY